MNRKTGFLAAGAALALLAGTLPAAAPQAPVGSSDEWHGVNGDSAETGFSRLAQVDTANAARLGLAWSLDLPGETTLQSSPIMVDGTLYFTGSYATVYAVDARTGQIRWKFEPKVWEHNPMKMNFGFSANRGVVHANGKLFSAALDGRVFALDAKTGAKLWEAESTDPKGMQTVTGAPRVIGDKVIIGNAGADFGQRGYVSAYDVNTGKQMWKTYVVPGNPEGDKDNPALVAAAKTWEPGFWKKMGMTGPNGGGGGPWDSMTWDEELGRVYVGTANAYDYDPDLRDKSGGDNLYTASILALDVNTGKYVWHYQLNPRDAWDYDATQQIMLATLKIGGKARKVLMQAPKNGFFYVIDRVTGKPLSAGAISKVNWADRIDMKSGRPVERPNIRYQTGEFTVYPFSGGAHSWMRMAYSPATGLVYVPTMQQGTRFFRGEASGDEMKVGGLVVGDAKVEPGDGKGTLVAYDPVAAKVRWKVQDASLFNGGTAVTAGNVVFQGTADGWFHAYDARDGKELWKQYLGMGIIAAPSVWAVDGKQYVSILAGYGGSVAAQGGPALAGWKYTMPRRLFTFTLDGKGVMPERPQPNMAVAALDNPDEVLDPKQVAMGKAMFMACGACHGKGTIAAGGPAPDLRESPIPLDAAAFYTVVHDGALIEKGMPRFAFFGKPQVEAIRQYVRSKQREAAAAK